MGSSPTLPGGFDSKINILNLKFKKIPVNLILVQY